MLQRMDHVNVVVQDLNSMTAFYRDVLKMRVAKEVTISGPWIENLTGFEEAAADVVYLETDSGAGLELICYRRPQGARPSDLGAANTLGIRHIAYRVADLNETVATLQQANVELLSPIQEVPAGQVDFAGKRKLIVYCRDPEGNLLELCSFE